MKALLCLVFALIAVPLLAGESAIPEVHSIALRLLDVPAPASAPPSGTLCVCTANGLICDCPDGVCPEGCLLVSADLLAVVPKEPAKTNHVKTTADGGVTWTTPDGRVFTADRETVKRFGVQTVVSVPDSLPATRSASPVQYTCANGVCTPIQQTATTIPDDFHTPWYHPLRGSTAQPFYTLQSTQNACANGVCPTSTVYQNQNVTGSPVQYMPRAVFGGGNRLLGGGCAGGKCGR